MKMPRKLQNLADELGVDPVYVGEGLWVAVVNYTPDLAAAILEHRNPYNRSLPATYTRQLGMAMREKRFPLTGETILFNKDANVSNGQGRLSGVQWSGESVKILTVFGVDHATVFPVLDHGRRRSLRDVLFLSDRDRRNLALLAAAVTRLYEFFTRGRIDGFSVARLGATDAALLDFSATLGNDLDEIIRRVATVSKSCQAVACGGSHFAALMWLFSQLNPAAAEEFYIGITQSAMPLDDVRWSGARRFVQRMQRHDKVGRIHASIYTAFLIKAWNGFVTNTEVERLNLNARSDLSYPRVEGVKYAKDGTVSDPRFTVAAAA